MVYGARPTRSWRSQILTAHYTHSLVLFVFLHLLHIASSTEPQLPLTAPSSPSLFSSFRNNSSKVYKPQSLHGVLVLFVDGLRHDYVTWSHLKHFQTMKNNGGYVKNIQPVFPTDCMPNMFSMFTGAYPETHGILSDVLYDPHSGTKYNIKESKRKADHSKWLSRQPLWVTARHQGIRTSSYNVPICDGSLDANGTDHCLPYQSGRTLSELEHYAIEAASSLVNGATQLAVVYYDALHEVSHTHGPESSQLERRFMPHLDRLVGRLLRILCSPDSSSASLRGKRTAALVEQCAGRGHLVVAADHGMSSIAQERQFGIGDYMLKSHIVECQNYGSYAYIWPIAKRRRRVFEKFKALELQTGLVRVFYRESIPAEWRLANHSRSPSILVVAKNGYYITDSDCDEHSQFPWNSDASLPMAGWHGYAPDVREMHTPLLIFGPKVQRGTSLNSSSVVGVYSVLCRLLDLSPHCHPPQEDPSILQGLLAPVHSAVTLQSSLNVDLASSGTSPPYLQRGCVIFFIVCGILLLAM